MTAQSRTIATVAPFLRAPHGHVFCVENSDGSPVVTSCNHVLVVLRGMLHGTLSKMEEQVDYTFDRVREHGLSAVTVIEANHSSFRFPDSVLRSLLSSVRKHEDWIHKVYFVGLSRTVRLGFSLFATPFMDPKMRAKMALPTHKELCRCIGHTTALVQWGGAVVFDADAYIDRRANIEGVASPQETRHFDHTLLRASACALRECANRTVLSCAVDGEVFREPGEKQGSGGLFGSVRWKPKVFVVSNHMVAYADADDVLVATAVDRLDITSVSVEGRLVFMQTCKRGYKLRFRDEETALRFRKCARGYDAIE